MRKIIAWYLRNYGDIYICHNDKMRDFGLFETYLKLRTQTIEYIKVGEKHLWIRNTYKKYWFQKLIKLK